VEKKLGWSVDLVERPRKPAPKEVLMRWAQQCSHEGVVVDWQRLMPPKGFVVLPRRWVVECSFAWICHNRRMSKDYAGEHGDTQPGGDDSHVVGWVKPLWDALYAANADVIVNGHDHSYERYAPQNPSGTADPARGLREFVVGTGGTSLRLFKTIKPNSEVRNSDTHGVLKLNLNTASYDWQFAPVAGKTFTDSGSDSCH
jgi:hypothetical protein